MLILLKIMPAASNALVSLQDAIYIFSEPGLIPNDQSSRDATGRNRSVDRSRSPGDRSPSQGFSLMKFIIFSITYYGYIEFD